MILLSLFMPCVGSISSSTLKSNGRVNGKDVHILVDSGSIHCFIDEKVVQVLGCKLEPTIPMMVRVADGGKALNKLFCLTFCWEIQGHQFSRTVRVFKLGGGYDCVLGCKWLSANNPIELGFHELQVTVNQSGKNVILKALSDKGDMKTLSVHSLSKLLRRGVCRIKGQLHTVGKEVQQEEDDPRLLELLHQFKDVVQEPNTLPP
ncbi:UNVERIFIED_CONTAM: hypothetical protein Slati_2525000 [Sesamum latifolium]|uniref:Uncharacterized protein n=1 Tax=Sesamum latifolium TaxID=2727402 RepID=A0AAW2WGG2_9LAMI